MPGDKFTNPYNFVGWVLPQKGQESRYRRPYMGLDRFQGYSGRIKCTLTTLTPFFNPGETKDDPHRENHKIKHFLRLPDPASPPHALKPAILATSLKGMIRGVVEAATNSCYAVFDPEQHYSYRPLPKPLAMGIVSQQTDGSWILEKMESARVKERYLPRDVKPQEEVFAHVEPVQGKPFLKEVVMEVLRPGGIVPKNYISGSLKATGFINRKTGKLLVENKKHEKFVFVYKGRGPVYLIPDEVVAAYNQVLVEQNQADSQRAKNYDTRLTHPEGLTSGDIVYFMEGLKPQGNHPGSITALGAVAVPRFLYRHTLGEFLPEGLQACKDIDALCPACRLFGWVRNAYQKGRGTRRDANRAAVAGRIFFSHGYAHTYQRPPAQTPGDTLAILSTPKPTTSAFYLVDQQKIERFVDYNDQPDPVTIRGRKFYWHHKPGQKHLRERGADGNPITNDQNSTVELIEAGVTFEFTIDFTNLEEAELGMLLWALEFDGNDQPGTALRHKLGMGKPLGLGSVHIQISGLEIYDEQVVVNRYQPKALFGTPTEPTAETIEQHRQKAKAEMKAEMKEIFGKDFDKLLNIRELKIMLNQNSIRNPAEVHYPKLPGVQESFAWFVQNNRLNNPKRGTFPYTLPTAEEEKNNEYRLPDNPKA